MDDAQITALARRALPLWGGGRIARLIANRENAVFEVVLHDGTRAALRLHRAGYQTDAAIESELVWMAHLHHNGFPCPAPLETTGGQLVGSPAFGPRASLVTWIDAPAIGAMGRAFNGTRARHCALYHALGALIARMHALSDSLTPPAGFQRPDWNIDALTGDDPLWGRYWANPALSPGDSRLLCEARDIARARLLATPWNTGLIHADLLQENILGFADTLHIIDFDDGGSGLRMYDLGTAMVQHWETPHHADLAAALCDGYGSGHRDLPLFTMLRALASCGWVVPRFPPGDPRLGVYARRAVESAKAYLRGAP